MPRICRTSSGPARGLANFSNELASLNFRFPARFLFAGFVSHAFGQRAFSEEPFAFRSLAPGKACHFDRFGQSFGLLFS